MALRAYARRRGISVQAVLRAIKSGRLKRCLILIEGKPQIADPDLADRELDANTDHSKAPDYVKARADQARASAAAVSAPPPPAAPVQSDLSGGDTPTTLSEASAEEKRWRAKLAELEYRKKMGELVDAEEMKTVLADAIVRCKAKLLAIPSKAKAQIPDLTIGDVATLERIIRESLEELVAIAPSAPRDETAVA